MCTYKKPNGQSCPYDGIPQFEGGQRYCLLHLPIEQKRGWGAHFWSQLSQAIVWAREEAAVGSRSLDLSGIALPENARLEFKGTVPGLQIQGGVIEVPELFAGMHCNGDLLLQGVSFPKGFKFVGACVEGTTTILGLPSAGHIDISKCIFERSALIESGFPAKTVTLDETVFRNDASIYERNSPGEIFLRGVQVSGTFDAPNGGETHKRRPPRCPRPGSGQDCFTGKSVSPRGSIYREREFYRKLFSWSTRLHEHANRRQRGLRPRPIRLKREL